MRGQVLQQRRTQHPQTPRARSLVIRATVLRPEPLRGSTQQLPKPGAWRTSNTMQDLEASAAHPRWEPAAPVLPAQPRQPVLLSKLVKAHAARVSALVVLKDRPDCKLIVSSSLDKYLATWKVELASNGHSTVSSSGLASGHHQVECTRLAAPGGPVFSLVRQPQPATGSVFIPTAEVIYCGNASKEVVAWEVKATSPTDSIEGYQLTGEANFQTVATGYTGWVRALALMGKWLFSCGCNFLVQHDTSFPIPKEVSKQELFKGDIQAIVAGVDHVYIASADGMIRAWTVAKKTGALSPAGEVPAAHNDRITGLAIHGSTLYSTGFDGSIKAWNADSLALVAAVPAAHGGEKVHAIVVGSDGLLYTGGDDKLIRSWRPLSPALDFLAALEPVAEPQHQHQPELHSQPSLEDATSPSPAASEVVPMLLPSLPPAGPPLSGHASSVRVLAAGSSECLVSGDSDGDLCVWAL